MRRGVVSSRACARYLGGMRRRCHAFAFAFTLGMALWAVPAIGSAQANMPRHVDDLVSEVLVVIDEVKRDQRSAKAEADGKDGEVRNERSRQGGILPFTRTMVNLLWKGLPVQRTQDDVEPRDPVRVRVKPCAGGGQVRWVFTF
jgi:hypothetical protein